MDAFERLLGLLSRRGVRFVVIGLSGANYYARSGAALFATQDRDLFLEPKPDNVLEAWQAAEAAGLELSVGPEPLDEPRDRFLAERIVTHKALVRASDGLGLDVDLTLVMAGFDFATVWKGRRIFRAGDVEIPVARLTHIVESKRRAGRDKDRLFFAAHAEAIRDLLASETRPGLDQKTPTRRARRPPTKGRPRR
jgi:hypothetical protein